MLTSKHTGLGRRSFPHQEKKNENISWTGQGRGRAQTGRWRGPSEGVGSGGCNPGAETPGLGGRTGTEGRGLWPESLPCLQDRGEGRPALKGVSDSHPPAPPSALCGEPQLLWSRVKVAAAARLVWEGQQRAGATVLLREQTRSELKAQGQDNT